MPPSPSVLAERGSTGPQDLMLVQGALRGERGAADALLARLSCIHRFTFRLNRTLGYGLPTDALEDVVQQVYTAVWPRLRDYVGSAAIESWVFGFCRNCLRAEARRRRHSAASSLDVGETRVDPAADVADTGQVIELAEGVDALRDELQRLDTDERTVVEMRFLDEQSYEQIARMLAVPVSTVKDRCYRALQRLKGRLRPRDGQP